MFKEGQGRLVRPLEHNYSYYKQITGSWSRGILHSKRTEMRTNLDVFPIGYLQNYKNKAIKHLTFVAEVKKGIFNGPATIYVNGKKLCKTKFYDCVEMISAWNHPIGRNNFFTSDLAALNCFPLLLVALGHMAVKAKKKLFCDAIKLILNVVVQTVELTSRRLCRKLRMQPLNDDLQRIELRQAKLLAQIGLHDRHVDLIFK